MVCTWLIMNCPRALCVRDINYPRVLFVRDQIIYPCCNCCWYLKTILWHVCSSCDLIQIILMILCVQIICIHSNIHVLFFIMYTSLYCPNSTKHPIPCFLNPNRNWNSVPPADSNSKFQAYPNNRIQIGGHFPFQLGLELPLNSIPSPNSAQPNTA